MNPFEQLGSMRYAAKRSRTRWRRYMKKLTRRARRREARLLDDAPPKHFKGWAD